MKVEKETLFKVKQDKPSDIVDGFDLEDKDNVYFTTMLKSEFTDSAGYPQVSKESNALAGVRSFRLDNKDKVHYLVLTNDKGQLYDPHGLFMEESLHKVKTMAGRKVWTLKKQTETVFKMYLEFLKTGNKSYLLNAQRKATDG